MIDEIRVLKAARFRPCHCDTKLPFELWRQKGEIPRSEGKLRGRATRDGYFERFCHYRLGVGRVEHGVFMETFVALVLIAQSLIMDIMKEPIVHLFLLDHDNIVMAN
ncbi:hypothetical protein CEXT_192011 [Caerostris extrusa]|uniref:Uncharacterized protein n=1 Tax=Caerostris extrusa TaxID=172846 RepID=A0AAV4UXP9_CAEEX|nr:hypothetical protein CEXT_192011 [Caerostris extrusa]